jgi:ribosome production factor 2
MVEFGVSDFESLENFAGQAKAVGSKPVFAFLGDQWEQDSNYTRIMNLLIGSTLSPSPFLSSMPPADVFRGDKLERLSLKGLDHVITCSVSDGTIFLRPFSIHFKKGSGRVSPLPSSPSMTLIFSLSPAPLLRFPWWTCTPWVPT